MTTSIFLLVFSLGCLVLAMYHCLKNAKPASKTPYVFSVVMALIAGIWLGLIFGTYQGQKLLLQQRSSYYSQKVTYTREGAIYIADTTYERTLNAHPMVIPIPNPKYYRLNEDTLWLTAEFNYQYEIERNKPPN